MSSHNNMNARRRKHREITGKVLLVCLALSSWHCASSSVEGLRQSEPAVNPLAVPAKTSDFARNPELLDRIKSSAHGYFRFINIEFSREICQRFSDLMLNSPSLNLHGDAHIEQYAITDLGRGLTDFDDSSTGPGIIDLLRFGVSLDLTCRQNGWPERSDELYGLFLTGYMTALNNPDLEVTIPAYVTEVQRDFSVNRSAYFEWIDSIMQPMEDSEREALMQAMKPYVNTMQAENPGLDAGFFEVMQVGNLQMGIGSALDQKYLVRVRGDSDDPMDDVVLECKEVRDITGIPCIQSGPRSDPFRVLLGQARIAYRPFRYIGYFSKEDKNFWVHSWVDNYKEISISKTFKSADEMPEIVYDIGVQLGLGHVKHIAAPLDLQLRRGQLALLNEHKTRIMSECHKLADEAYSAWEQFCRDIGESAGE